MGEATHSPVRSAEQPDARHEQIDQVCRSSVGRDGCGMVP